MAKRVAWGGDLRLFNKIWLQKLWYWIIFSGYLGMSRYLVMQNWTFLSIKQLNHLKSQKPWWPKYSLLPPSVALLIFKQVISAIAHKQQSLQMLLHTPKYPAESIRLDRVLMRWLRCPHVSIVSTSTMRLTYAPILFLQVQLFAIVWVTLYGWKKRLLCRQTRFPHVDFTPTHSHYGIILIWQLGCKRGWETHVGSDEAPPTLEGDCTPLWHITVYLTLRCIFSCYATLCCMWYVTMLYQRCFTTLQQEQIQEKEHKSLSVRTKLPPIVHVQAQTCELRKY